MSWTIYKHKPTARKRAVPMDVSLSPAGLREYRYDSPDTQKRLRKVLGREPSERDNPDARYCFWCFLELPDALIAAVEAGKRIVEREGGENRRKPFARCPYCYDPTGFYWWHNTPQDDDWCGLLTRAEAEARDTRMQPPWRWPDLIERKGG